MLKHHMYYIALVCPEEVDRKVLRHKHWLREHCGCVNALKSPAHLTLIPPFWLEEGKEEELVQALQSFTSDTGELVIAMNGFDHFGKKVLFIHVEENPTLQELKKQVEAHFLHSFGNIIKPDQRPFHPHITLATRDLKPSGFVKAWEHFDPLSFRETFNIGTLSLLRLGVGKWEILAQQAW